MKPLIFFRNVIGINTNVKAKIELRLGLVRRGFAFHFADGALQHLGVEFEADGFDVAALFSSQKISCAAQFQV